MAEVIASGRAAREVIGAQEILKRFLMSLDRRGASGGSHEKRSGAVLARASGMEMEVDDTMTFKHHTPNRRSGSSDAGGATRWCGKSGHHRAGGPPPPLRPGCHLRLRLQPQPETAPDASPPIPRGGWYVPRVAWGLEATVAVTGESPVLSIAMPMGIPGHDPGGTGAKTTLEPGIAPLTHLEAASAAPALDTRLCGAPRRY